MTKFTHIFCITSQSGEFGKTRRATLRKWARRNGLIIDWVFGDYDQKSHMTAINRVATIGNIIALIMEDGVMIERAGPMPPTPRDGAVFLLEHNIFNLHPAQAIAPAAIGGASWLRTISTAGMPRAYIISPRIIAQLDRKIQEIQMANLHDFSLTNFFCEIQVDVPTYALHPSAPTDPPTFPHPMIQTCLFEIRGGAECMLTLKNHPRSTLPRVSIVVPTYNRPQFAQQIKFNVRRQTYPVHLIQLVIVDDSPIASTSQWPPGTIYHHIPAQKLGVCEKRNLGATLASGEIIAHMDDDDVYFPEYISTAVNVLMDNPTVGCVGSTAIGCYDIIRKTSFISGSVVSYFAEASMVYRRSYWAERPFDVRQISGEGIPFIHNRIEKCMQIPWMFSMIAITHNSNMTPDRKQRQQNIPGGDNIFNLIPTDSQVLLLSISQK